MLFKLRQLVGDTGFVADEYGGYVITVKDNEKFPWRDVFETLLASGFDVWIDKKGDSLQVFSKYKVE